jgi:hypothetical protein
MHRRALSGWSFPAESCCTQCGSFLTVHSTFARPRWGGTQCDVPETKPAKPVEFHPARNVHGAAVESGKRPMAAGGLDAGGIEYLEAPDGRLIFYDINANSNLRAPIVQAFGFDPFERVADFLVSQIYALPNKMSALAT